MISRAKLIKHAVGRMPPFKPELRAKIRKEEKTQTRRIFKADNPCPYPKGLRYMIEPLTKGADGFAYYRDDGAPVLCADGTPMKWKWSKDILTSIHMPTDAARLFVWWAPYVVQPVQSITEEDAIAEGCRQWVENGKITDTAVSDFAQLWNEINLPRGFGWETNPTVNAYKFHVVKAEEEL